MAKKFAAKLSDDQMKLARKFESAGLCSISQAVKAFDRGDRVQINEWKSKLNVQSSSS